MDILTAAARLRLLLYVLLAPCLLLCLAGCRQSTQTVVSSQAANMRSVESAKGYIIDLPKDWEDQQAATGLIDRICTRPKSGGAESFIENVNIVVEPMNRTISLDDYFNANLSSMQRLMKDFRMVNSQDFAGNVAGKKLVYIWGDPARPFKVCTFFFTKGATGYVVTCTAIESTYSTYESTFDDIGRSFRWK